MKAELLKFLRIFITPSCWIRCNGVNKELDKWVRDGLQDPKFEKVDDYYVRFNGKMVWIENYPYSYCTQSSINGMPTRRTIFWFRDAHTRWVLENNKPKLRAVS